MSDPANLNLTTKLRTFLADPKEKADPPDSSEATPYAYWWQQPGQEELPFPLEFLECAEGPECTRATGKCDACSKGHFQYRMLREEEQRLSESDAEKLTAQLHARYPKISSPDLYREKPTFRTSQTSKDEIRQRCWRDLFLYEATDRIPKKWRDTFRVDPYGNVVALEATMLAACAFEVDHIFPWCRGGLSVPVNFVALYWGANRHVKSDRIPNSFSAETINRMQCGLSVENFLELLAQGEAIEKRHTRLNFFNQLKHLLLSCIGLPSNLSAVMQDGNVCATLLRHQQAMLDDLFGRQP